jgi:hypothetical protein
MSGALQAVFMNMRSFGAPSFIKTSLSTTFAPLTVSLGVDSTGNSALVLNYQNQNGATWYSGWIFNGSSDSGSQVYNVYRNQIDPNLCCGSPTDATKAVGIVFDSSGNSHVTTLQTISGAFKTNISKFNSSGTLSWQRQLTNATVQDYVNPAGIFVDSSSNVFVLNGSSTSGLTGLIAKYDSSGAIQFKRDLAAFLDFHAVTTDSSGNIYICGTSNTGFGGSGFRGMAIAKLDSTGVLVSQASFGGGSVESRARGVNIDTSGNIYVSGSYNSGGTVNSMLVKLNSSLAVQWSQTLGGNLGAYKKPAFDTSGNIYVSNGGYLAKYNSSGTLQFQRTVTVSGTALTQSTETYVIGNKVYFGAYSTGSPFGGVTFSVPTDGSLTGTYSVGGKSITYASSSQTDTTVTLATSTPVLTSVADTTTTDAAGSFSQYVAVSTTNSVVTL